MMKRMMMVAGAALVLASPLEAQQAPQAGQRPAAAAAQADEPRLVLDREVFTYAGSGRRDPFRPLTGAEDGPLFSDLSLRMIVFSQDPASSLVLVADATGKVHRLRRGDRVGSTVVLDIARSRVVFSVEEFGIRRQEVLEMTRQGARR